MKPVSIILADAQPVFREGIKSLLTPHEDFEVISEAGNTRELLPRLLSHRPDILILDYNPAFFNDRELTEVLKQVSHCKVIILSSQGKKWQIFKSLEFNVCCYLTKECGKQDVLKAIQAAAKGEKFYCSFIVDILLGEHKHDAFQKNHVSTCLTEREKEITRLVAVGMVNKEIATELNVSPHTVHSHRKKIMKKLGVHSAVELANYAKEMGILE